MSILITNYSVSTKWGISLFKAVHHSSGFLFSPLPVGKRNKLIQHATPLVILSMCHSSYVRGGGW